MTIPKKDLIFFLGRWDSIIHHKILFSDGGNGCNFILVSRYTMCIYNVTKKSDNPPKYIAFLWSQCQPVGTLPKNISNFFKASSSLGATTKKSSKQHSKVRKFWSPNILLISCMKLEGLLHNPCGRWLNSYCPKGIVNTVNFLSSSHIEMLSNPDVRSITLNIAFPLRAARQLAWQIWRSLLFFHTNTIGEAHSLLDFQIMSCSSISDNTCRNFW